MLRTIKILDRVRLDETQYGELAYCPQTNTYFSTVFEEMDYGMCTTDDTMSYLYENLEARFHSKKAAYEHWNDCKDEWQRENDGEPLVSLMPFGAADEA